MSLRSDFTKNFNSLIKKKFNLIFFFVIVLIVYLGLSKFSFSSAYLNISISSSAKINSLQIFYDLGQGFNQIDSIKQNYRCSEGKYCNYKIPLSKNIKKFRIDPGSRKVKYSIRHVYLSFKDKQPLIIDLFSKKNGIIFHHISPRIKKNSDYNFVSRSRDPYIIVNNTELIREYLSEDLIEDNSELTKLVLSILVALFIWLFGSRYLTGVPSKLKGSLSNKDTGSLLIAGMVIIIFTLYAFFISRNSDELGNQLLLFFAIFALIVLFRVRSIFLSNPNNILFLIGFVSLSYFPFLLRSQPIANSEWLFASVAKLLLSLLVLNVVFSIPPTKRIYLQRVIAFSFYLLAFCIIGENLFQIKHAISKLGLIPVVSFTWNQKNYEFLLLFLYWGAIGCVRKVNVFSGLYFVITFLTAYYCISNGYSQSVRLAFFTGTLIFIVLQFKSVYLRFFIYGSIVILNISWPLILKVVLKTALIPNIFGTFGLKHTSRIQLFENVFKLINENIFGYGFGSTLQLPFPGGHPHNLFSMFWLELGIIGAFFLSALLFYVFTNMLKSSYKESFEPALVALIVSGFILFLISFSIWQTDVVLMHCMFWFIVNTFLSTDPNEERFIWKELSWIKAISTYLAGVKKDFFDRIEKSNRNV